MVSLGDGPAAGQAIFGDVLAVHVDEAVLAEGDMVCDPDKLQAVGRMGGNHYSRTIHPFTLVSLREPDELDEKGPSKIQD